MKTQKSQKYTLTADDKLIWSGSMKPTQAAINFLAVRLERRGWNGTFFELYIGPDFLEFVHPHDDTFPH